MGNSPGSRTNNIHYPQRYVDWSAILQVNFMSTRQLGNLSLLWRWEGFLFSDLAVKSKQAFQRQRSFIDTAAKWIATSWKITVAVLEHVGFTMQQYIQNNYGMVKSEYPDLVLHWLFRPICPKVKYPFNETGLKIILAYFLTVRGSSSGEAILSFHMSILQIGST